MATLVVPPENRTLIVEADLSVKSVSSVVLGPGKKRFIHFDWAAFLAAESTSISTYEVSAPYGVTVHSDSETAGKVTVLVSATRGSKVSVHVVFVDGQEDTQTMIIRVQK